MNENQFETGFKVRHFLKWQKNSWSQDDPCVSSNFHYINSDWNRTKIRWDLLSVSHDFRVAFWYFNSLIFWSWIINECVKWTEFKSASSIDHWWIIKYWIQDYREWCRMHVMLWMIQWSIDALFTNIGDWCHLEAHYHKQ